LILARTLALAGSIAASAAHAQGPPPFELEEDASRSVQVVGMQLGLNDPDDTVASLPDMTADSLFQVTENHTTLGNGIRGTGILRMFPLGTEFTLLPSPFGLLLNVQPQDSGSRSIMVYESPSVTPGLYAPYVDVGTYFFDITCSAPNCNQWLESPIESRAESSYDHADGTLEVDASVETPDYGVTDDTEDLYHALRSTASARVGDWIHATGAGETATVTVAATLPLDLDEPDGDADDQIGLSHWETQGSGDLRELGCFDPIEPTVIQYTRFRFDIELVRWRFEQLCEFDEELGEEVCTEEWVDEPLGVHTVMREREMHTVACESALELVSSDTGALPGSTQLQVEIPTGEWVELSVTTSTDANCEGAMACDLDAQTSAPIEVTVDSPNATVAAWRGIAGLTRVPEPGALAGSIAALAVMLGARRLT